jgi:hypothetical protein
MRGGGGGVVLQAAARTAVCVHVAWGSGWVLLLDEGSASGWALGRWVP